VLTTCSDQVWLNRVIDEHILNDDLLPVSYHAVLTALRDEMTHAHRYHGSRGLFIAIDYKGLERVILLQVMVGMVELLLQTCDKDTSYLYDFKSIFCESTSCITELVVHEANSYLDQQFKTLHTNIMNYNDQPFIDFAELLLPPSRRLHDAYSSVIQSVDNQLWNAALESSCRRVAQQTIDDWFIVSRVPRKTFEIRLSLAKVS